MCARRFSPTIPVGAGVLTRPSPADHSAGRDDSARRPGLPRFRRRGGTLGRPPSNRRTSPQFPIYVSKRPTKAQIPPYLNGPKAFPPVGPTPLVKGRWPKARGDRVRCPSVHTEADEGAVLKPRDALPLLSHPHQSASRLTASPWKGEAFSPTH